MRRFVLEMFCFRLPHRQETSRMETFLTGKQRVYGQASGCILSHRAELRWKTKKLVVSIQGCKFVPSLFLGAPGNKDSSTHAGCVLFSFPRGKSSICLNNACYTSSHPGISHEYYL